MQTLQVDKTAALEAFSKADKKGKEILKSLFGESISEKITDKVKTFEEACTVLGIKPEDVLHAAHSKYLVKDINSINAYCKLIVIARALNEGWEPDWNNDDEVKYYPWFYMNKASGFCLISVDWFCTHSDVGSRLCFKNEDLAKYAATQFVNIYKDFFTL